jgi:hypothetical protein
LIHHFALRRNIKTAKKGGSSKPPRRSWILAVHSDQPLYAETVPDNIDSLLSLSQMPPLPVALLFEQAHFRQIHAFEF